MRLNRERCFTALHISNSQQSLNLQATLSDSQKRNWETLNLQVTLSSCQKANTETLNFQATLNHSQKERTTSAALSNIFPGKIDQCVGASVLHNQRGVQPAGSRLACRLLMTINESVLFERLLFSWLA